MEFRKTLKYCSLNKEMIWTFCFRELFFNNKMANAKWFHEVQIERVVSNVGSIVLKQPIRTLVRSMEYLSAYSSSSTKWHRDLSAFVDTNICNNIILQQDISQDVAIKYCVGIEEKVVCLDMGLNMSPMTFLMSFSHLHEVRSCGSRPNRHWACLIHYGTCKTTGGIMISFLQTCSIFCNAGTRHYGSELSRWTRLLQECPLSIYL